MESTAPKELMETCGSSSQLSASRAKAIEDGRATSIAPSTSISLSADGYPSTTSARTPRAASSRSKWWYSGKQLTNSMRPTRTGRHRRPRRRPPGAQAPASSYRRTTL